MNSSENIRGNYLSNDDIYDHMNLQLTIDRTLTISTRNNSNEKWTFIKHLNYPLNPADIQNLGQKTQPCKSKHNDVVFTFTSKKEFYKTIIKNVIEPLDDNFKTASGN